MGYYKIKNVTNSLAKRHSQKNKSVSVKLNEGLFQSEHVIESGDQLVLECIKLPIDLQKLRMKGYITVVEISKNQFLSTLKEIDRPEQPTAVKEKPQPKTKTKSSNSSEKYEKFDDKKTTNSSTTNNSKTTIKSKKKTSSKSEE